MEKVLIIHDDNGLHSQNYTDEEITSWIERTPSERFDFFLKLCEFSSMFNNSPGQNESDFKLKLEIADE